MKIHNFFPLSIFQDQIQMSTGEKNNLIKEIRKMKDDSKNLDYKLKNASWTGDTQGFEYLHKNKAFNKLFDEIKTDNEDVTDFVYSSDLFKKIRDIQIKEH